MSFRIIGLATLEEMESKAEALPALFEAGLPLLHLRTKLFTSSRTDRFIRALPAEYHPRLVLHTHYELKDSFNLGGLHLTEESKFLAEREDWRKKQGNLSFSASFHTPADLLKNQVPYRYVLLSPVFDSISKAGYKSPFQPGELKTLLNELKTRQAPAAEVMALGGIRPADCLLLQEMGFAGAVLNGALWTSADLVKTYLEARKAAVNGGY